MELQEFIKETLVQISNGIYEANVALKDTSAIVNPDGIKAYSTDAKAYGRISTSSIGKEPIVELVSFDVAVQVESGSQTGGGLKLSIASIGLGAEGQKSNIQSSESRIKFQIPMIYPKAK